MKFIFRGASSSEVRLGFLFSVPGRQKRAIFSEGKTKTVADRKFYIEPKNCRPVPEKRFLSEIYVHSYRFRVLRKIRLTKESEITYTKKKIPQTTEILHGSADRFRLHFQTLRKF